MTNTNERDLMPAILRQKLNAITETHINHALGAYCLAKGYAASTAKSKRVTLIMVLPYLKAHSSKWNDVRLEHLRRTDHATVKAMTTYLSKTIQDTDLLQIYMEEDDKEQDADEELSEDLALPEDEKKIANVP